MNGAPAEASETGGGYRAHNPEARAGAPAHRVSQGGAGWEPRPEWWNDALLDLRDRVRSGEISGDGGRMARQIRAVMEAHRENAMTTTLDYTPDTSLQAVEWPHHWRDGEGGILQVCAMYKLTTLGELHEWLQTEGNPAELRRWCRKPAIANFAANLADKAVNGGKRPWSFRTEPKQEDTGALGRFPRMAARRDEPDVEEDPDEVEPPEETDEPEEVDVLEVSYDAPEEPEGELAAAVPQFDIPPGTRAGRRIQKLKRINRFLRRLAAGLPRNVARDQAGVADSTYYKWLSDAKSGKPPTGLLDAIEEAEQLGGRATTPDHTRPVVDEPDRTPAKPDTPTQDVERPAETDERPDEPDSSQPSTVDCQQSTNEWGGDDGYGHEAFPTEPAKISETVRDAPGPSHEERLTDLESVVAARADRMAKLEDVVKDMDRRPDEQSARRSAPPRHPLIEGLIQALPQPDTEFNDDDRVQWFETAASVFNLLYTDQGDDDE